MQEFRSVFELCRYRMKEDLWLHYQPTKLKLNCLSWTGLQPLRDDTRESENNFQQ